MKYHIQTPSQSSTEPTRIEPHAIRDDNARKSPTPSEPTVADDVAADGLLSTEEVAGLLGVDPSTLRHRRNTEPPEGPPFVPISKRVTKYWRSDVFGWISRLRVVTPYPAPSNAAR